MTRPASSCRQSSLYSARDFTKAVLAQTLDRNYLWPEHGKGSSGSATMPNGGERDTVGRLQAPPNVFEAVCEPRVKAHRHPGVRGNMLG